MPEFRGVNTDLNFELLNCINRGKGDIGIEVRIGVVHAVQRVVIERDALPACGYGLSGAITPLTRSGLPRRWR